MATRTEIVKKETILKTAEVKTYKKIQVIQNYPMIPQMILQKV
jgi:hypothetical protein